MKKRVAMLLTVIALLTAVVGCGKKEDGIKIEDGNIEIFHNDSETDIEIEW